MKKIVPITFLFATPFAVFFAWNTLSGTMHEINEPDPKTVPIDMVHRDLTTYIVKGKNIQFEPASWTRLGKLYQRDYATATQEGNVVGYTATSLASAEILRTKWKQIVGRALSVN